MDPDRQGLALPVFVLEARQRFLAPRIVAEKQDGRFGKSPFEIGVADLRAGGAIPLPGGFFGAFDQAALDVRFISLLPVMQRPACMAWADKRRVQIVWAEG